MLFLKLLKKLNTFISIVIVMLASYIIVLPFLPALAFALNSNEYKGYVFQSPQSIVDLGVKAQELPIIPKDNRIVIPRIFVNASITEGNDESALDYGMWHMPGSSNPELGGNTVISGHRFLHTMGVDTLFNLDKVKENDLILIYWYGKEYVYKIFEIIEVSPDQIDIEDNTVNPILTLYTCTPLWTSQKRLVIKANLQ